VVRVLVTDAEGPGLWTDFSQNPLRSSCRASERGTVKAVRKRSGVSRFALPNPEESREWVLGSHQNW